MINRREDSRILEPVVDVGRVPGWKKKPLPVVVSWHCKHAEKW